MFGSDSNSERIACKSNYGTTTMLLNSARSPIVLMEQITVDGVSTLKEHSAGLLTPTCSFWVYIQLTIDR